MDGTDLIAGAHCALGMAYLAEGEFDTASAMLEECVRLGRLRDLRVWQAWAESALGDREMGDQQRAARHLTAAMDLFCEMGIECWPV